MRAGELIDDRFEIEAPAGAGGMGQVYRARDRQDGGPVAVKLLTHGGAAARERFFQESLALAEIQHPGVVRYVAHGYTAAGEPYLAMEWLEGEDLASYLRRHAVATAAATVAASLAGAALADTLLPMPERAGRAAPRPSPSGPSGPSGRSSRWPGGAQLSVAETVLLGRRLASAVAELHRRGIVHRDIKPANLFLCQGAIDQLKLLDLGTVRHHAMRERLTETGRIVGTPHYMAPEQARSGAVVSPATDVWAIGCVLYECLAGAPPFSGDDLLSILTSILMDTPAPLQRLRDDVPDDLARLIEASLSRDPAARPADAATLARALDELGSAHSLGAARQRCAGPALRTLTTDERRVTCVLLADASHAPEVHARALADAVAPCGGALQRLADGTVLVTIPGVHAPTDQAARAARAALALREVAPELRMALATGQSDDTPDDTPENIIDGHSAGSARHPGSLGQMVSRAAQTVRAAPPGIIQVDSLTATLLDAGFVIARQDDQAVLRHERATWSARTLLGKPTRWVGRRRELSTLLATFDDCVDEHAARAVLVTAVAGMGKSRLRHELERALACRGDDILIVNGQGDAVSAGSPFVMIAPALRRLAGILDGEPAEPRRRALRARLAESVPAAELDRVTAFIGEMIGVPFDDHESESLRAARKDPMVLGQLMKQAWLDWLRAECARRPVLMVLEDLHWGDLPSVQYVDSALDQLADQPLMVLALARPEVHSAFPRLWHRRDLMEIRLRALSPRASATLVRDALGAEVADSVVDTVVQRAGGNAFYLEELIRAVADSASAELPDTILGMVQARLHALGPEARRILRAGSIFGEIFWRGGVAALSGQRGVFDMDEWLEHLVAREVIEQRPGARLPGETEYKFRHALVRDSAYAMLTADDRRLGHALAAAWLERVGEQDGLILAEHSLRGGEPERAISYLCRAAEQALEGNDLRAVLERAEHAVRAGASGEALGALRALQSTASYWLSDYAGSRRQGREAATLLSAGSSRWFMAMGNAIVSSARLGNDNELSELFATASRTTCAPGAEAEKLICLCRGTFQLIFQGRLAEADRALARIADLARTAANLDPLTAAQVTHLQGLRADLAGDIGAFLRHLDIAVAEFERAGDSRNAALERSTIAWCWAEIGYFERAAVLCRDNLARCQQQNAQQATTYARVILGHILACCDGQLDEARQVLDQAIAECCKVGNSRLEGWARGNLSLVEHLAGNHELEEREARRAIECLRLSPTLQGWALACHARALLALGRPGDALDPARRGLDIVERLGGQIHGHALPSLVWAQVLHAVGDHQGAAHAIRDALDRVQRRAAMLPRPEWREVFFTIPEHRAIRELAALWTENP